MQYSFIAGKGDNPAGLHDSFSYHAPLNSAGRSFYYEVQMSNKNYFLGIDIGSTTVKIAVIDDENTLLFSDYQRHYAEIQETAGRLIAEAYEKLGDLSVSPAACRSYRKLSLSPPA